MTKSRFLTLSGGVVALALISWWRMVPQEGATTPSALGSLSGEASDTGSAARVRSFDGQTMGTTYSVKLAVGPSVSLEAASNAVEAALRRVDEGMSTYKESSEVSRFNQMKEETPFSVSFDLLQVLLISEKVHGETDGAFDITVRPLLQAYGFGSGSKEEVPAEEELALIRKHVGMSLLSIDPKASRISRSDPELQIDLSGVAKGYGVDAAAIALQALGVENYLVEVGGELRFRGSKPGSEKERLSWTLAIEEPYPEGRRIHGILKAPAGGGALATSGDYRSFRMLAGERISHTFDPRTGQPVARRTASVSVLRPTAAEADALATALGVLSPEKAINLSNHHGWAVYLLVHKEDGGFEARSSKSFQKLSFENVAAKR